MTGQMWRLGYRPALDGLRAIAVTLVLLSHGHVPFAVSAGAVGVTVFFTLSGFLITTLLLEERARSGRFRVAAFYGRRFRRLMPAMLLCVALAAVVDLLVAGRITDGSLILGTLTYTSNWVMADGSFPLATGLGHTWSLAIEEQFYLVWPLLLLGLRRVPRRWVLALLLGGTAGAVAVRVAVWDDGAGWARAYFGFDARADALLIGCALAFLLHGSAAGARPLGAWLWVAGGVLLVLTQTAGFGIFVAMPTIAAAATAVVLYVLVQSAPTGWLSHPAMVFVGRRSYGLYLYHAPVSFALAVGAPGLPWWLLAPLLAGVSLLLAVLSWRFVEAPILQRGRARSLVGVEHDAADREEDVAAVVGHHATR